VALAATLQRPHLLTTRQQIDPAGRLGACLQPPTRHLLGKEDRRLLTPPYDDVQLHSLSIVSKTHPYRLREYDTETGEYVCILYLEDVLNFIHSYNMRGSGIQEDFIL
jgi:hypothetical protein